MSNYEIVPNPPRPVQASSEVAEYQTWAPVPPRHKPTMSLQAIITVLRRNLLLISLIVAVTGGIAWYRFSRELPRYEASALVRLVDVRRSITGTLDASAGDFQSWRVDPLRSQLEVLKGRSVLGRIVDSVGLRVLVDPPNQVSAVRSVLTADAPVESTAQVHLAFRGDRFTATAGGTSREFGYGSGVAVGSARFVISSYPGIDEATVSVVPRESAISGLLGGLQLRLREGTDAVDVQYSAFDPAFAREVVNASVAQFQSSSAEASREDSRRRRIFLEEQLRGTEGLFREVQSALSDFRARQQTFSSREEAAAQQQGIRDLDLRREELMADRRIYAAALNEVTSPGGARSDALRRLIATPGMSANPVVTQTYGQLLQHQSSQDSLLAGGATPDHPDVRRLSNLVASTEDRLVDVTRSHVAAVDARIRALDALRGRSTSELQALPVTEAEEVRLTQQVEAMSRLGDQLREELQKARISEAIEAGQVQVIHTAPAAALVGAPMSVRMAIALLFGLTLGIGAAFLRAHLDTTIRDRDEVERILRAPKLATIPRLVGGPDRMSRMRHLLRRNGAVADRRSTLVALGHGAPWQAEAYRTLRTNLIFSQTIRSLKRVVITSSVPGEGKTTTAANLAVAFAQQGLRVLLVDCDLRRPAVHRMFDMQSEPGLTQLALGFVKDDQAIQATEVKGLFILPAGTLPPNPAELLGGSHVEALLERVSAEFDMILLDTSPIMAASDPAILASRADGVILVVRAGFADRNDVELAAQQLAAVGARVIGAVFNDADSRAWPYERTYIYKSYHVKA